MKTLRDIEIEWLTSRKNHHDDSIILLTRDTKDGLWHFLDGKKKITDIVVALSLAHGRKNGLIPEYKYNIDLPNKDRLAMAMVINKKEGKIIIDGKYGFGFAEYEAPADEFFCYIRTEREHTFVFFTQAGGCVVQSLYALPFECAEDECFLPDVFSAPLADVSDSPVDVADLPTEVSDSSNEISDLPAEVLASPAKDSDSSTEFSDSLAKDLDVSDEVSPEVQQ